MQPPRVFPRRLQNIGCPFLEGNAPCSTSLSFGFVRRFSYPLLRSPKKLGSRGAPAFSSSSCHLCPAYVTISIVACRQFGMKEARYPCCIYSQLLLVNSSAPAWSWKTLIVTNKSAPQPSTVKSTKPKTSRRMGAKPLAIQPARFALELPYRTAPRAISFPRRPSAGRPCCYPCQRCGKAQGSRSKPRGSNSFGRGAVAYRRLRRLLLPPSSSSSSSSSLLTVHAATKSEASAAAPSPNARPKTPGTARGSGVPGAH